MLRTDGNYTGNDRFEGYAKDLTEILARSLNFSCKYYIYCHYLKYLKRLYVLKKRF